MGRARACVGSLLFALAASCVGVVGGFDGGHQVIRCPPTTPVYRYVLSGQPVFIQADVEIPESIDGGLPVDGGWWLGPAVGRTIVEIDSLPSCQPRQLILEAFESQLSLTPNSLEFERVALGDSADRSFHVRNLTDVPAAVLVTCTAPFSPGATSLAIDGRGETNVSVTFRPVAVGPVDGGCSLDAGASSGEILLHGTGGRGHVQFSPTSVDFGQVAFFQFGSPAISRTVTVANDGEYSLEGRWELPLPPGFSAQVIPLLEPGSQAQLSLAFEPTAPSGTEDHVLRVLRSDGTIEGELHVAAQTLVLPPCAFVPSPFPYVASSGDGGRDGWFRVINSASLPNALCLLYQVTGKGVDIEGWDGGTVVIAPGDSLPLHLYARPDLDPSDASVSLLVSDPNSPFIFSVDVQP